jgi:hypothetical protein
MAAITKVSLSFKETRQKTLAKLEGINRNRMSADSYRKSAVGSLKKQVFSISLRF